MTKYSGIDYGHGMANFDKETGIRFGVVNMNALNEWAWEGFEADYGEPTCGHCGNPAVEYEEEKHGEYKQTKRGCDDYACESCEITLDNQEVYGEEPLCHYLDDGEYKATVDQYNDVFVLKSPYFTYAQFCSPCAPGAGHLEHTFEQDEDSQEDYKKEAEAAGFPKTFCLGHEWFEDGIAPYPVYRVSDGSLVEPDKKG